ncbi:class I SAM-dependent methyltransferase [Pseudoduganella violaceinigra]|uniref:class I SAM-dependent methyltransferase n=1 Tax=Pseudoduganella violaceinigra TaxID=246602 RepID=UPI0004056DC8|nr:class I SAM-dependent methyltransferase [Pseudoduganella violaceinigra]
MNQFENKLERVHEPAHLNFACVLAGVEPVPLERPFNYLALGCRQGPQIAALEQRYPNGRFYTSDIALAPGTKLPPMDFIVLHTAYSWLDRTSRDHVADLCKRYLKPGGLAYIGYNALPGCSSVLPLQRLVREQARLHGGDPARQLAQAGLQLEQLRRAGAAYLADNDSPAMRRQLAQIGNAGCGAGHEFTEPHWQALHHADVARAFADAKLDYVASADFCWSDPDRYLAPAQRTLLAAQTIPVLRETVHDVLVDASFRRDVYVRGVRRMHPQRQAEWLGACRLASSVAGPLFPHCPASGVALDEALAIPVLELLAEGPQPVAALTQLAAVRGKSLLEIARLAGLLVDSGQISICPPQAAAAERRNPPAGRHRSPVRGAMQVGVELGAVLAKCLPRHFSVPGIGNKGAQA